MRGCRKAVQRPSKTDQPQCAEADDNRVSDAEAISAGLGCHGGMPIERARPSRDRLAPDSVSQPTRAMPELKF